MGNGFIWLRSPQLKIQARNAPNPRAIINSIERGACIAIPSISLTVARSVFCKLNNTNHKHIIKTNKKFNARILIFSCRGILRESRETRRGTSLRGGGAMLILLFFATW